MTDKLSQLDERINHLKKKKEKLQLQQALSYLKESQKIFKEDFSPSLALTILTESWSAAVSTKKETWRKRAGAFPSAVVCGNGKANQEDYSPPSEG